MMKIILEIITKSSPNEKNHETRMHSSRMRTARLLIVSHVSRGWGLRRPPPRPPPHWMQTTPSDAYWETNPPSVDRQTPVKTLPCSNLCLRAVNMHGYPIRMEAETDVRKEWVSNTFCKNIVNWTQFGFQVKIRAHSHLDEVENRNIGSWPHTSVNGFS